MADSATELAIEAIRTLILDEKLLPADRLPAEHDLAAQLGLSRNTLREAVRALVTARVLDVKRGDGTYVSSLKPEQLLDGIGFAVELMQKDRALELLELRRVLEPAATALAASRASEATLVDLRTRLDRVKASTGQARIALDIEFHDAIAAASGNRTIATVLRGVSGSAVHARIWHGVVDGAADRRADGDHEAILTAMVDRDPIMAQAAAQVHVANTERWYRQMVSETAQSLL